MNNSIATCLGQTKIITLISDGGEVQINPANFANGTSITLGDAVTPVDGHSVTLLFNNAEWQVVASYGASVTIA